MDHNQAVISAALEVVEAWTNAGPVPAYHHAAKAQLIREWPTLALAVEQLARAAKP